MLRRLISLFVFLAFLLPASLSAAFDLLSAVPAQYEVVASLDTRKMLDSPAFQRLWAQHKKPQTDAQLALIKSLTGVDVLKDIDRVSLFSRVNDDASVGVVFEGRFDSAKLLLLVQANATYKSYALNGQTLHEWFDDKEQRTKYAAFPAPGTLMIWNSRQAAEASTSAMATPANSLGASKDAARVPADPSSQAMWGVLITRQETCPGAKLRLTAATMTMQMEGENVTMAMRAVPESAPVAAQWLDLARGTKALLQIQRDNPAAAELANLVSVTPLEEGRVVEMKLTTTADRLVTLAQQMKQAK